MRGETSALNAAWTVGPMQGIRFVNGLRVEDPPLRGHLRPRCRDRARDGREVQGGAQGDLQRRGQATRAWRASSAAAHEAFAGGGRRWAARAASAAWQQRLARALPTLWVRLRGLGVRSP